MSLRSIHTAMRQAVPVLRERVEECKALHEQLLREGGFTGDVIYLTGLYWVFYGLLTNPSANNFVNNTGVPGAGTGTAQDFTGTSSPLNPYG